MPRYEVLIKETDLKGKDRVLIVYAPSIKTAREKVESANFTPLGFRQAGKWNDEKCRIDGDPYPIVIEDNMHLIPSRRR